MNYRAIPSVLPKLFLGLMCLGISGISASPYLLKVREAIQGKPNRVQAMPEKLDPVLAQPADEKGVAVLDAGEAPSTWLNRAGIRADEQGEVLEILKQYVPLHAMKPGMELHYTRRLASGFLKTAEIALDQDRILRIGRTVDGLEQSVDTVPVYADTVVVSGEITQSLYASLLGLKGEGFDQIAEDERRRMVDVLADQIFAWQMDFSRDVRKGDWYHIQYERMVRPDGSARRGTVLAAHVSINGQLMEGYLFDPGSQGRPGYYDADGNSLKQGFLRAPLEFRRISSSFGRRFHPIQRIYKPHNGVDYAASSGTPVRAVGDAVVKRAGWAGGYGNLVELSHSGDLSSRYAHLRGFAKGVRAGSRVRQGQIIGYVGSTGNSTGPHLHYEMHRRGRPINPSSIKTLKGDPVPMRFRSAFRAEMRRSQMQLARAERMRKETANQTNAPEEVRHAMADQP